MVARVEGTEGDAWVTESLQVTWEGALSRMGWQVRYSGWWTVLLGTRSRHSSLRRVWMPHIGKRRHLSSKTRGPRFIKPFGVTYGRRYLRQLQWRSANDAVSETRRRQWLSRFRNRADALITSAKLAISASPAALKNTNALIEAN